MSGKYTSTLPVFLAMDIETLETLASSKSSFVRTAVASKRVIIKMAGEKKVVSPFKPSGDDLKRYQDLLQRLATDPSEGVRASVVANPLTTPNTREFIWNNLMKQVENEDVEGVQTYDHWSLFLAFAAAPEISDEILHFIYFRRQKWAECLSIIKRDDVPIEILSHTLRTRRRGWDELCAIAKKKRIRSVT